MILPLTTPTRPSEIGVTSLRDAAFDSYLTAFQSLIPSLLKAYDQSPATGPFKANLSEQVKLLRSWDLRWSATSVATSLAVYWGEQISRRVSADARRAGMPVDDYVDTKTTQEQRLQALAVASDRLTADFG